MHAWWSLHEQAVLIFFSLSFSAIIPQHGRSHSDLEEERGNIAISNSTIIFLGEKSLHISILFFHWKPYVDVEKKRKRQIIIIFIVPPKVHIYWSVEITTRYLESFLTTR